MQNTAGCTRKTPPSHYSNTPTLTLYVTHIQTRHYHARTCLIEGSTEAKVRSRDSTLRIPHMLMLI